MVRPGGLELPTFWFVGGFCPSDSKQQRSITANEISKEQKGFSPGVGRSCTQFTENYTENLGGNQW
jgi:hypothetical protein